MASGASVGGLLAYMTGGSKSAGGKHAAGEHELGAVAYRNLTADNRLDARIEMDIEASRSEKCKKPFMHFALSWPPSERPSEARIIEAMDKTLAKLGLEEHQAVYAIHREKGHLHIHAAINRVGPDGRAWSELKSAVRLGEASHEVEKEMGFADREQFLKPEADREVRPTARQQRIYERTGVEPDLRFAERAREAEVRATALADRIKDDARKAMRADSWATVHANLAQHGLGLREYANPKNPKRSGLEIVDFRTGERCAASAIGSDYGKLKLEKSGLGAFVPGPENDRLRALGYVDREPAAPKIGQGHERAPEPPEMRDSPTAAEPQRDDIPLLAEYQALRRARSAERERALEEQRARDRERRERLREEQAARRRRIRELVGGRDAKAFLGELGRYGAALRDQLRATISGERHQLKADHGLLTWTDFVADRAERGDARAVAEMEKLGGRRGRESVVVAEKPLSERLRDLGFPNQTVIEAPQSGYRTSGDLLAYDEGAIALGVRGRATIVRVPPSVIHRVRGLVGHLVRVVNDKLQGWTVEDLTVTPKQEHERSRDVDR